MSCDPGHFINSRRMPFDDKDKLRSQKLSAIELRADEQTAKSQESSEFRAATSALAQGTVIAGQYKVLSLLGSGGMSQVYRCQDLSLNRQVAVKLLLLHTNSQAVLRFQREGKAIAMLNHENIVKVYALQVTDDQQPLMVMEVVNGISLAELVEGGKQMPLPRVLKFISQICDAITHAHEHGVIHRDLKPSNIMVLNVGQTNEQIKILDFGIAKIVTDDSIKATQTGDVFGSPAYMSPEQAAGKSIQDKTDQYSLGCVVFELLAGRPPFVGSNQISVIVSHLQDQPPALSQFCKKTIPPDIEKTVMRLLAKDPEKRFASIADVKSAFYPDSSKLTASKHTWSNLTSGRGIAVAVCSLVLLAAAAITMMSNGERGKPLTVAPVHSNVSNEEGASFQAFADDGNIADQELGILVHSGNQDIDLRNKRVTDASMQILSCLHSLNSVNLDGCKQVGDDGILSIGKIPIRKLFLSDIAITDKGLKILGEKRSLTDLDLSNDSITDKGLAYLKDLDGLTYLQLGETDITGDGLKSLDGLKNLKQLYLDQVPKLHGKLKSIESLNSLTELSLTECDLDNADLVHLSPLKNIVTLALGRNVITDLEPLTKLPQLHYLSLVNCAGIDGAAVSKFLAAHPHTVVTFNTKEHPLKRGSLK
jgi:serine/threonine protein kinase